MSPLFVPPSATVGPPGKSAYELSVENGFVGTKEEWLASLKPTNYMIGVGTHRITVSPVAPTDPRPESGDLWIESR